MKINNTKEEIEQLKDKELVITSYNQKESRKQLEEEINNAFQTEEPVIRRNFDSEMIRKILTPKRKQIINQVAQKQPESITQLAEQLQRTTNQVSKDLEFLNKAGIIYYAKNKNKKQPVIPFKNIQIDLQLIQKQDNTIKA